MSVWATYTFLMRAMEGELEADEAITFGRLARLGPDTNGRRELRFRRVNYRESDEGTSPQKPPTLTTRGRGPRRYRPLEFHCGSVLRTGSHRSGAVPGGGRVGAGATRGL